MIKKEILIELVRDNPLHNKIYAQLDIRQATIAQSFKRCVERNKISGQTHHPEVLEIIENHLNLTRQQLLES